ncbi:hypothetical protein CVT26_002323 [Gymnopilus dilepis]|uniref:Uncharacterized protein n=1 Tax=Gymnopilus dilepis TaxID=231916 RepID=A0A409Y3K6_9AGAR|nr:hypothetical protein CVT26_002323 [Gymnopilus dilepis]
MSASLPSTSPNLPAAATSVVESTVAPALFLLVPVFTFVLVAFALCTRSKTPRGGTKTQKVQAYAIIGTLAIVSTLVGALPLGQSRTPQPTAVLQALLSFLLGIPVLHLITSYAPSKANKRLSQRVQRAVLVILLSTAYSVLALPRIAVTLFHFLQRSSGPSLTPSSISKPTIKLFQSSRRVRPPRRPITIHVETHRTSIPLSLPSPASSTASLSLSDPNSAAEQPIELDLAFPSGKEGRSRLKEGSIQPESLYQDEKKSRPVSSSSKDEKPYQAKHDKTNSLDSTTSTITNFDTPRVRYRSHSPPLSCLPSSLPLVSLTSPPRAVYTAAFTADPDPPPFTSYAFHQGEEQVYQFPRTEEDLHENLEEANTRNEINSTTAGQSTRRRSYTSLVLLFAAQLILVLAYTCGVAAAVVVPELWVRMP